MRTASVGAMHGKAARGPAGGPHSQLWITGSAIPRGARPPTREGRAPFARKQSHLSEALTLPKTLLRFDPTPLTTVMIATAIPEAISPYSMAVAPASLRRNRLTSVPMLLSRSSRPERLIPTGSYGG